jgi:hypothetical protein
MNHLAILLLGESFAVEIQARQPYQLQQLAFSFFRSNWPEACPCPQLAFSFFRAEYRTQ